MPADALLHAAARIGHALAADALWWEGRCTWTTDDVDEEGDEWTIIHRTCPADLYSGTAGIGLYLARLAATLDDPVLARTARGALRHAARHLSRSRAGDRNALFLGRTGAALATALSAEWLGDDELHHAARTLALAGWDDGPRGFAGADLISGWTGGIVGTLALWTRLGDEALRGWAVAQGDAVLAAAREGRGGLHWPSGDDAVGMCGLSHGAAGVAWALAELAAATGQARFGEAAARAVAYEQSWFDAGEGNWHDLFPENLAEGAAPSFSANWCHGAPGIALARARLWRLTGEDAYLRHARVAVATTAARVREALDDPAAGFSLCHGLAGNADALLTAGSVVGDADAVALARAVAETGVQRHGASGRAWPSGVGSRGATSPSLMLGTAGVGWFLLRVLDPSAVPSLLLVDTGIAAPERSDGHPSDRDRLATAR